jgi:hypothetical protein
MDRKNPKKIAEEIREENEFLSVRLSEISKRVERLQQKGLEKNQIKQLLLKLLKVKEKSDKRDELKQKVDKKDTDFINVERLPQELDRDDWT